jgi:hypothetical protein
MPGIIRGLKNAGVIEAGRKKNAGGDGKNRGNRAASDTGPADASQPAEALPGSNASAQSIDEPQDISHR